VNRFPLVTVVVPARNEAADIEGCIESVAAQDYPVNRIEVIVVDGVSPDGTAALAERALRRWDFGATSVLSNPEATTPSNLNVGLHKAKGEILCRVDARTRIEPHHVRTCVGILVERRDVAVVGGAQVAVPRDATSKARGIARALNNRWSMGGSRYRSSMASGPTETVYLGAFRTADLLQEGGWDERFPTNQDFELNRRMGRQGLVWFEASLRSGYLPRAGYRDLWRQYRRFGRWKATYWKLTGDRPQLRQLALLAVPMVAALGAMVVRPRHWGPVGVAGLVLLDEVGSSPGRATIGARVHASAAAFVVAAAWTVGVWSGLAVDR
jgi:succinoglycan biosynthesis protein ExoA